MEEVESSEAHGAKLEKETTKLPELKHSHSVSCPPALDHSISYTRSPLLLSERSHGTTPKTNVPRTRGATSFTPNFLTPLASPVRKGLKFTKLGPDDDAWLPITESRSGNAYYAAFHTLCSGIGIQALVLPLSFSVLGWTYGILSLSFVFAWQLYTLWVLVQLHESRETRIRCSRYIQLTDIAFGNKLGKFLASIPLVNLAAGTCTALVIIGGSAAEHLYTIICEETCNIKPLTTVEWYLVFTSVSVLISQLPNLNSIAGVSLIGAITAIGYCTMIWTVSVAKGKLPEASYHPVQNNSIFDSFFSIFNAFGIIAFAFRGHNLILEIQGTLPSTEKHPSHIPMWKGVKMAYMLVALCLFPLAVSGYWAYGNMIPENGSLLDAFFHYHSLDVSRSVQAIISVFVIVNSASSFQIYGMPSFDQMESIYTSKNQKPCPWWVRTLFRVIFGYMTFLVAVALPFLGSVSGLIGGLSLPVTLVFPCFMWLRIEKPTKLSSMWWVNWFLGTLGVLLTIVIVAAGIYSVIHTGVKLNFFQP